MMLQASSGSGTKPICTKPHQNCRCLLKALRTANLPPAENIWNFDKKMNYKYLLLAVLITSLIAWLSSIPEHSLPGSGSLSERVISNLAHIPAYALLTLLWLKSFVGTRLGKPSLAVNSLVLVGLLLFAVSDEIHQSFVPGRTSSFMDIGLDLIGIFCGLAVLKALRTAV